MDRETMNDDAIPDLWGITLHYNGIYEISHQLIS